MKEDKASSSRALKFLDSEQNQDFKCKLQNAIHFKLYLEASQRKNQRLDAKMAAYFMDPQLALVSFDDSFLNEEHKVVQLFEALSVHPRLRNLSLANCGLSDDSLELLLRVLA